MNVNREGAKSAYLVAQVDHMLTLVLVTDCEVIQKRDTFHFVSTIERKFTVSFKNYLPLKIPFHA